MKFVCLTCETYMNFEKVEKPAEGSLGVFFGCPSCGAPVPGVWEAAPPPRTVGSGRPRTVSL